VLAFSFSWDGILAIHVGADRGQRGIDLALRFGAARPSRRRMTLSSLRPLFFVSLT
jgi:hypothetical protein